MYVFRLVCEAQGEPAPDVFWTRENRDKIVVTDKKSGRRTTGQCGQGQGVLTIGATMDDNDILKIGNHSCIIINFVRPPYSSLTIKIQIHNDKERSHCK